MTDGHKVRMLAEIREVANRHGHLSPPEGSFTVDQYVAQVRQEGGTIGEGTALRVLKAEMNAGTLIGRKFKTGGKERWYFWSE